MPGSIYCVDTLAKGMVCVLGRVDGDGVRSCAN